MKLLGLTSLLTGGLFILSSLQEGANNFKYNYQIKANSYAPRDSLNLYYYKEMLIDKYEELVFTLKEEYVSDFLSTNISQFKFDDKCNPKYMNGSIILTIGEGKGSVIEGKLRINSCDTSVIREKIYIFDIFN